MGESLGHTTAFACQFRLLTKAFWEESAISTFFYPPHPVAPRICDSERHPHPKPTPGFTALPVLASDMALSWVTESWEQFPSESHRHLWCRTGKR